MIIKKCTCVHEYQDKKYGEQNRACTVTIKETAKCTVCGKELK